MSAISLVWTEHRDVSAERLHELSLSSLAAPNKFVSARRSQWSDGQISLGGHFADSLPEDRFDRQPLWSADRTACLIADLRLDNRAELTREMGVAQPETLADSDFLLAAWQRWGTACVEHLLGGFAFAVWLPATQEIFAARDHTGERPLFYYRGAGCFALASLPKGILALSSVSRGFDDSELASWLASLPHDRTRSMYAAIWPIPAGHTLLVTRKTTRCRQYWHPAQAKPTRYQRDQEYAESLVALLDQATKARLRGTRGVGSFLSSGLDSSSVTASAALLQAARGQRLSAFTSVPRPGFQGLAPDSRRPIEGEAAAEIARLYPNVDHFIVDSRDYPLLPTMKRWIDATDAPAGNVINLLWFNAILDRAREQGLGVLLQGLAGNITISWSSWNILGKFFRTGRWIQLWSMVQTQHQRSGLSYKTALRYATAGMAPLWLTRKLVNTKAFAGMSDRVASPEWMTRFELPERIFQMMYRRPVDFTDERSGVFESTDDGALWTASHMLTGIEIRDPTADKRIYDFCFSIPPEQYAVGGHTRSLVRRAMKGRLPESMLMDYRRGLQGADWYIPVTAALPELYQELAALENSAAAQAALNLPAIRRLLDEWPQSGFHETQVMNRWHYALVLAFSVGYFLRSQEASLHRRDRMTGAALAAFH